ncbi:hypothetical protein G7046_g4729 [Stylonectria norvegica]|nr:hypothetical protein G7046_g4729 [Stylonectria norvegica]
MPTYLCHGFRWHRRSIRIFVIIHDLEDASPDWIIRPTTSSTILSRFYREYDFLPQAPVTGPERPPSEDEDEDDATATGASPPLETVHQDDDFSLPAPQFEDDSDDVLINSWSAVKLLEEYDPEDLTVTSRPYAYVADYAVRVELSVNVLDEMAKYESRAASKAEDENHGWFEKLRDNAQPGEAIGWYIVVCGDEERSTGDSLADDDAATEPDEHSLDTPKGLAKGSSASVHARSSTLSGHSGFRSSLNPPPSTKSEGSKPRSSHKSTASRPSNDLDDDDDDDGNEVVKVKLSGGKHSKVGGLRRLLGMKDDPKAPRFNLE